MQSGPVDIGSSTDTGSKVRQKNAAAPVVGTSSATPTSATAASAQVELQIIAVNLSSATSAASSVRTDAKSSEPDRDGASSLGSEGKPRSAASLELSARAQRLALIPAQVMDPEELARAQEELEQVEEDLEQVRANNKKEQRRSSLDDALATARERSAESLDRDAATSTPNRPSPAEALGAQIPSTRLDGTSSPEAPPSSSAKSPGSSAPRSRPDPATLAHGRSPFESSTPGSTGQSLDIVVGE